MAKLLPDFLALTPMSVALALLLYYFVRPGRAFIRSLKNKHIFITGGSSGIGLSTARKALLQGAHVTLVSRSKANLQTAAESLVRDAQCNPDSIRWEVADVGDYDAISSAIKRSSQWKPIDCLICNAGITKTGGYLGDAPIQGLDVIVRTNLMGSVNSLHAALPELKRRSQNHPISIVIVSSLASMLFLYGQSVYTATKCGLKGLAEALRFELFPYNIKVSLICPSFTNTSLLDTEAEQEPKIVDIAKWVNYYDRRSAESPDSVAHHIIAAIRTGSFLVTTTPSGAVLAALGRGLIPADSFVTWMTEMILFFPLRVTSVICLIFDRWIICRKCSKVSPLRLS